VPLFNLVYHDAILLPWCCDVTKGGWGIPQTDCGLLHALANAGMPYLSIEPSDEELERVRTVARLHARIGQARMVNHEFLDSSYRRQRTSYDDGTTVTIDLDAGHFEISPPLDV